MPSTRARAEAKHIHSRWALDALWAVVRWHVRGAQATWLVVALLVVAHVAFSVFLHLGWDDAINLGLVLQSDWFHRGGLQWVALLANGFVTFSLQGLLMAVVVVFVCLPWLERRIGWLGAAASVLLLALALGPIKIAMGAPGAVGASKFIPMLQVFWLADNPLLHWFALALLERGSGTGVRLVARCVRHAGWLPAAWLAWGHVAGDNPAHGLSAAAGLVIAALLVCREAPWRDAAEAAAPVPSGIS